METGTTSALDRMALTERLTDMLVPFLEDHKFIATEFGQHVILNNHGSLLAKLKRLESKKSKEVLMIKFSPDFICSYNKQPNHLFMMDAKTSITPVFFPSQIEIIRNTAKLQTLRREDIGEVEREAWDVYNSFYPKERVVICFACPYHPRLIVAEWVSKITPLYRLAVDRNMDAGGSMTPHVNIHLGKMRTLKEFVEQEFNQIVDEDGYNGILDFIKTWPLNKPRGRVNWIQFNNVITRLQQTCPWLKQRWPEGHPGAGRTPLLDRMQ